MKSLFVPMSFRAIIIHAILLFAAFSGVPALAATPVLKVLFLGDNGHHRPAERLRDLGPEMMKRGIQLVYTEDVAALSLANLKRYDALLIYANIDTITPAQEQGLLDYVTQGGGLFALHSASYSFRNSDKFVALVGAQFKSHGTGVFRTTLVAPNHPILQGFSGFESWDETYVHTRHNEQNRTVLEVRDHEPWTWTRTEGLGRVFYTAWGHDERTWRTPGFQDLVERGLRYTAGQKLPGALSERPSIAGFEVIDQPGIPYYPPGQRSQGDGAWAQMPKPLTPEQSMQHLVVPGGFEVQLVASEPDIRKPIAMAWDERGRLWLAETLDYPNRVLPPGEVGRDRIVICEDTNGDGRMDKFTVFSEGLNIPTSLTFANGGVIVQQMPNTVFLKDTDGDGKADLREVLFTGWGRRDTHAGPNNLVYGFDNWIWGIVGYSGFNGSVGGAPLNFAQAFYRFRPDGSALEAIRSNNNNSWGLGFTEEGFVFGSTANNNPSVYVPIPDRYYAPAGLTARVLTGIADTSRFLPLTGRVRQVDVHWGYTAAAGHAFYTARAYPKEYWNQVAFVAEPTGHLVGQFKVEATGANFRSKNPTNLIVSDDEWFAPIMAEVGPDGAMWVIDWYNYIVQHNPTPKNFQNGLGNAYDNDLRDKRFGRIYRIVWKGEGAKPATRFSLANATPAQLVAALAQDNLLWRRHAQRLLVERGRKDVVPDLLALVRNPQVDEIGLNVGAIHALWTLHGLHAFEALPDALAAATDALGHPSAGVRRNALGVLPHTAATAAAVLKAGLLSDSDAQVRLAALLALADAPATPAAGAPLHAMLAAPDLTLDRWTVDGAKMAAVAQQKAFLSACTPAETTAGREALKRDLNPAALVDAFEQPAPLQMWVLTKTAGETELALAANGRAGGHSLQLAASGPGANALAAKKVSVKRHTRYSLAGWIKLEDVAPASPAIGAFLSVPQITQPQRALSVGLKGTNDWSQMRVTFDTGALTEISVACGLGGGGLATGTAWFDDLSLTDMGPTDETIANPLSVVLAHVLSHTGTAETAAPTAAEANVVTLELATIPDVMKFDRTELTIKAGQNGKIVFKNNDHMPHNVVVVRTGALDTVGALADGMLTNPQAMARSFVPDSPDVLFNTPLVNPGEAFTVAFTAPTKPGRYPIVCTFPGHWRIMQAVLVVTGN